MYGQYIVSIDRELICDEETFQWESRGELRADTESEITAAQDHATKILQTETDSKCGLCLQFDESVDHIITALHILAK